MIVNKLSATFSIFSIDRNSRVGNNMNVWLAMDFSKTAWVPMGLPHPNIMARIDIDPEKYYNARQVAGFLNRTPETIKAYFRDKRIPAIKEEPRGDWRCKGSEVIRIKQAWNII